MIDPDQLSYQMRRTARNIALYAVAGFLLLILTLVALIAALPTLLYALLIVLGAILLMGVVGGMVSYFYTRRMIRRIHQGLNEFQKDFERMARGEGDTPRQSKHVDSKAKHD
ncbi:MAG: hypothetical protein ACLFVU_05375 [Phycisphaerae bacterium]